MKTKEPRPPGWREERSPGRASFSFRDSSIGEAGCLAVFAAPAAALPIAVFVWVLRDGAFLAALLALPFAALGVLGLRAVVSRFMNRVDVIVESGSARVRHGPIGAAEVAVSFAEVARLTFKRRQTGAFNKWFVLQVAGVDGAPIDLPAEVETADTAAWVISRLRSAVVSLEEEARSAERAGYRGG